MKNNHGKGNRKEQRKRRRQRLKSASRTKNFYWCIDGNKTNHPVAYCTYHHGVLTQGLMHVHRCKERECQRLREGDEFD